MGADILGRRLNLTCTLIVRNEADRVERAIRSVVGLADEVLVIDSGSTDGTVALCERLGARVLFNPWPGFGPQKRFAEDQATYDWILNLDADEWLSETLRAEIAKILSAPVPASRAFRMRQVLVYPGRETPAPFASHHNYIRLYNRTKARFRDSAVHDEVVGAGDVVQLSGDMLHRSYRNVAHILVKTVEYYQLQAKDSKRLGPASFWRLLFEFPFQFVKYYVFRRHIFGGADGFVYAVALAMGRWARVFILMGW
jgi:glycosyltransferase involved in cell wall biosynthesis